MLKSIIVSLSLALFTLAARLLWDQKDVFLISYWGRPHPEVHRYDTATTFVHVSDFKHKVVSVIYGYRTKDTAKKEICPITAMNTVSCIVFEEVIQPFNKTVFICIFMDFFEFRLAGAQRKIFWCISKY